MKRILALTAILFLISIFSICAFADTGDFTAMYASTAPIIDGEIDEIWEETPMIIAIYGGSPDFAHGYAKLLWNEDTLYLMAQVFDSTLDVGDDNIANQACFWVSETCNRSEEYTYGDWGVFINQAGVYEHYSLTDFDNIETAVKITDDGYVAELCVPIQNPSLKYSTGAKIGFCISIEDDVDGDNVRDHYCDSQKQDYWSVPYNLKAATLIDEFYVVDSDIETVEDTASEAPADKVQSAPDNKGIIIIAAVIAGILLVSVSTFVFVKKKK